MTETIARTTPTPAPQNGHTASRLWRSRTERAADTAAAQVRASAFLIETERARAQVAHERLEHEREILKAGAELGAERQRLAEAHAARREAKIAAARQARWERIRSLTRRASLAVVLAGANVGVNAAAVVGQVLALCIGLGWDWWAAIPLALVVESVAVNVGYFAHDKLIKGYSAMGLRLLSYGIGAGVGWFNYTHNASHAITADFAGVFGAASVLSPVLWQIYSQWRHWDVMREQELLEPRAPKMTKARWLLWLGETWFIYRRAVREGISDRAEAVVRFRPVYEQRHAPKAVQSAPQGAEPLPAATEVVELAAALQRWSDTQLGRGPGASLVTTSPAAATASATDDATEELPPDPYGSRLARTPWLVADLIPLQLPPRAVLRPAGDQPMQITVGPASTAHSPFSDRLVPRSV